LNDFLTEVRSVLSVDETDFVAGPFVANQTGVDRIFDVFTFGTQANNIEVKSREGYKPARAIGSVQSYPVTPFDWLALKSDPVTKVVVSNYHACALLRSGQVYCWGKNGGGSLGNSTYADSLYVPVRAGSLENVKDIATEDSGWTCALTNDGKVYCWGTDGSGGTLGGGPSLRNSLNTPTLLDFLSSVSALSLTKNGASCALLSDGRLTCWGDNGNPFDITTDDLGSPAIKFSAGGTSSCALLQSGQVKCFGWGNSHGELGNTVTTTLPNASGRKIATVQLKTDVAVAELAAGGYYACALFEDGTVQCWGKNNHGQLGNGSTTNSVQPVDVTFTKAVVSVKASATHSCAVLVGGNVVCWGRNDYGQLGVAADTFVEDNGIGMSIAASNSPIANSCADGAVTSLSLAYYTSCALTSNGHYQCWGSPANERATVENPSVSSCERNSELSLSPF